MKYEHGGDIYRNSMILDFSANINPLGIPRDSIKAAEEGIRNSIHYPDYLGEEVCIRLGQKWNLTKDEFLIGNGAAEIIYGIAYGLKPKKALFLAPMFSEYEISLRNINCQIEYFELNEAEDFVVTERILSQITKEKDIMYICNPNNPTGQVVSLKLMQEIAEKCKKNNVILVIDECFIEFLDEFEKYTMVSYLSSNNHIIIINAFTKIYGMPGLRLGYAISLNYFLLEEIKQALPMWNTSIPAQAAGIEAIKDKDYLVHTRLLIGAERQYLLDNLKFDVIEKIYGSSANFIFLKGKESLADIFLEKGIMIRDCSNFKGLSKGYFRIAIRTHNENEKLITCMREYYLK